MNKLTLKLETLTCPSCVTKIEQVLKKTKGINEYTVLFNSSKVKVIYDNTVINPEDIAYVISRIGYDVLSMN